MPEDAVFDEKGVQRRIERADLADDSALVGVIEQDAMLDRDIHAGRGMAHRRHQLRRPQRHAFGFECALSGEDAEAMSKLVQHQRLAYFAVVILLVPAMIWTGLAMSPAVTSVAPFLVNVLGGQQSARTMHFAVACALVLFLAGHVAMVALSGFRVRMRGMITGRRALGAGGA